MSGFAFTNEKIILEKKSLLPFRASLVMHLNSENEWSYLVTAAAAERTTWSFYEHPFFHDLWQLHSQFENFFSGLVLDRWMTQTHLQWTRCKERGLIWRKSCNFYYGNVKQANENMANYSDCQCQWLFVWCTFYVLCKMPAEMYVLKRVCACRRSELSLAFLLALLQITVWIMPTWSIYLSIHPTHWAAAHKHTEDNQYTSEVSKEVMMWLWVFSFAFCMFYLNKHSD